MPLPRSFMRRMRLSTSGTCSFAAVVLTARIGRRILNGSNSLSVRIVPTTNLPCKYTSIMQCMPAASCLAVRFGVYLVVIRFKPLETLTKNKTPFTNMTSIASMTRWCLSRIALGIMIWSTTTDSRVVLTLRPLTPSGGRPKIRLEFSTAVGVTGQSTIIPERTILRNSRSVG